MDDFEKYITDNVNRFDEEPADGHFERFEQKLMLHSKKKRRQLLQRSMRVASVAALLVVSILYINERFGGADVGYMNVELQEAQYYYKTQISSGISTLETIDGVLTDEQRALLMDEMQSADELLQELQEELKTAPDDPRVIAAMLQHYRLKANAVNRIVNELQQLQLKENHYETQL